MNNRNIRILIISILALHFGAFYAFAEVQKKIPQDDRQAVPVELGGIKLGSILDKSPNKRKASLFGYQGDLAAYVKNGKVSRVVFGFDYEDGQYEKAETDVQAKITELCRFPPVRERGLPVWRGPHSVIMLSQGKFPAVVLQSSDSREPGNTEDGFDKFITDLRAALAQDKYKEVAKFFKFPFPDYLWRAYPDNHPSLECKSEKEFISKYSFIFNQKRKKEFMETTPSFDASRQTYGIASDPSEFIIRHYKGRWYISEYAYQE